MDLVVQVAVVEEVVVVVAGGQGKFIGEFLLLNRFTTFRNDYAHGHTYLMLNWERKSSW